jgi:transcription initiation factor TFIIIB Brf1 subunit/transcription initiation factor TFIIB
MQVLDQDASCPECLVPFVDVGDEMVCPKCGRVKSKQCEDTSPTKAMQYRGSGRLQLGSFMGTMRITPLERASKGIAGSNSKYEYLKVLSDFAGRDDGPGEACDRIIGRVGEKLFLPRVVVDEASAVARTMLSTIKCHRRVTLAALSAFSLAAACRVEGVTSVSVREIISAHAALGRRVNSSSYIQLALESPIKILPRRSEDYISRVLARLSWNRQLSERLRSEGAPQAGYFKALRETAKDVISQVKPDELEGRRPCALAAAAIYSAEVVLSSRDSRGKRLTQRIVAECGDAAEYTIREQCASIFAPAVATLIARKQRPLPAAAQR